MVLATFFDLVLAAYCPAASELTGDSSKSKSGAKSSVLDDSSPFLSEVKS